MCIRDRVYLWTNALYETYAPYIQSQLPDVNIEFIVGNNDLDFYKFLQQNGGLPDIITCCRFSLHDAAPLDVYKRQIIYLANNIELSNEASRILNLIPDEKIRQIAAQKHTYSRLIYQRRNKIVHEFYDVKSPMNFVENQSEQLPHVILRHSFIDEEYTPEHWVLNIPEQFIVNVFHSAIEGYLMYCQQNQPVSYTHLLGFAGGTKSHTELNQWIEAEKQALASIMARHDIEWEQKETHEEHLSVLDYKKQERSKEVAALETQIGALQEQTATAETMLSEKQEQLDDIAPILKKMCIRDRPARRRGRTSSCPQPRKADYAKRRCRPSQQPDHSFPPRSAARHARRKRWRACGHTRSASRRAAHGLSLIHI